MARFQFISRSLSCLSRSCDRAIREGTPSATFEPPQGPGWFDSSFDLTHGLEVREAGERGYDEWLAARANAERRAAAWRRAGSPGRSAPGPRVDRHGVMDLTDLAALAAVATRAPAPAAAVVVDDFSRFDIEGLALA